ncbi:hypothetical protein F1K75_09625 [Vibrio cholerae]|nr:hypothetical protein [Vibrio cholerae]MEB3775342.1 hypothetical protein [Vibrio sp. R-1]EGQ9439384.1 hypothetical protein [Vibrio cholerae]EGR0159311.1 hypothetical protein [Vibrio cholerae]EGR0520633.1 hypothetical protein [Vibrio cholerae]
MVKSNFRLKKPQSGAFLLIPASPLVISACFIFSFKIKKRTVYAQLLKLQKIAKAIDKILTSLSSNTKSL